MSSNEESIQPKPTPDDLAKVIAHLQGTMEHERATLSRVLHDDLGGLLVAAVMDLGWIEQQQVTDVMRERLKRVRTVLAAAIDLKRNMIEDLRPTLLDNFGLFAAYRWHVKHACERAGVTSTEQYPGDELKLQPEALVALFRIMQESLAVILSEQAVKTIDINVMVDGKSLQLRTTHLHEGLETVHPAQAQPVLVQAIAQRVAGFGGSLTWERFATGTIFVTRIPLSRVDSGSEGPTPHR